MAGEVGILTVGQLINIVRLERLVRLIRHNAKLQNVIAQCKKPTHKWHIWFFPKHKPTLKKPKEPFFANALLRREKIGRFKILTIFAIYLASKNLAST